VMTQFATILESRGFKLSQARGGDPLVLVRKSEGKERIFVGKEAAMKHNEFEQIRDAGPDATEDQILAAQPRCGAPGSGVSRHSRPPSSRRSVVHDIALIQSKVQWIVPH
jgi:hypothetical protein